MITLIITSIIPRIITNPENQHQE